MPCEIIKGALHAAPELEVPLYLIGDPVAIQEHLPNGLPKNIEIVRRPKWWGWMKSR